MSDSVTIVAEGEPIPQCVPLKELLGAQEADLAPDEQRIILQLRRVLHALDSAGSMELLLGKMKETRTNVEFLMQIQKTTLGPGTD